MAAKTTTDPGLEPSLTVPRLSLCARADLREGTRGRQEMEVATKAFGWKTVAWRGGAVAAALVGTAITGTEAKAQAPREKGTSTFVASRDEIRVPAPPDRLATEAELAYLKRLAAERSATS